MSSGVTRRTLFSGLRGRSARRLPRRRRPPGAVDEASFLAGCTGCRECVEACPHNSVYLLAEHVEIGAGTPVMVPDERPCHGCEGFPCAKACPEGVLRVPEPGAWSLGSVSIDPGRCLPFLGPECGACWGLCPDGVEALHLRCDLPVLEPDQCVGCGKCIRACPTRPRAIQMVPLTE